MRTTIDLDPVLLDEIKSLKKREKKNVSEVTNALLAEALSLRHSKEKEGSFPSFEWHATDMKAKVDLADKETLWKVLGER